MSDAMMRPLRSPRLLKTLLQPRASRRCFSYSSPLPATFMIRNISFTTSETLLREALTANGVDISDLTLVGKVRKDGTFWSRGYAFLETPDWGSDAERGREDEERVLELDGLRVEDREIRIQKSTSKPFVKEEDRRDEEEGWAW